VRAAPSAPRAALSLGLALLATACRPADPRPNLLLVSLDSVRADYVGARARLPHAGGLSPTPELDRLAAQGVVYANAHATTSWTLPSHVSLLTGVTELEHGVEQDSESIPAGLPTLGEELSAAGYRTCGVYSGPYLDPRHGFGRGFQRYQAGYGEELAHAADERAVAQALLDSIDREREPERARVAVSRLGQAEALLELASHRDRSSARVTALALEELARAAEDGRPFFLFAHYFDPHFDYSPPEPWATRFDPDYSGTLDGRDYFTNPAIAPFDPASPSGRRRAVSGRDLEHLQALYAGEIGWTDAELGRLLAELERLGLASNTLVVVVSDHGDEFFEHGSIGHRRTLFEEVLRVPVLLRFPGRLPAGEEREDPISLADVTGLVRAQLGLSARPAGPAPIARLVRPEFAHFSLALDGQPFEVDGLRVHVQEAFWADRLKLLRTRSFAHASENLEPARRAAFDVAAREEATHEELLWIDLDAHPDEEDAAWSADFDQPRAREALRLFRASHAELARRRELPGIAPESAELLGALRGLGYAGQEARLGALPSASLVLPAPGEGLAQAPR